MLITLEIHTYPLKKTCSCLLLQNTYFQLISIIIYYSIIIIESYSFCVWYKEIK